MKRRPRLLPALLLTPVMGWGAWYGSSDVLTAEDKENRPTHPFAGAIFSPSPAADGTVGLSLKGSCTIVGEGVFTSKHVAEQLDVRGKTRPVVSLFPDVKTSHPYWSVHDTMYAQETNPLVSVVTGVVSSSDNDLAYLMLSEPFALQYRAPIITSKNQETLIEKLKKQERVESYFSGYGYAIDMAQIGKEISFELCCQMCNSPSPLTSDELISVHHQYASLEQTRMVTPCYLDTWLNYKSEMGSQTRVGDPTGEASILSSGGPLVVKGRVAGIISNGWVEGSGKNPIMHTGFLPIRSSVELEDFVKKS